MSTRNAVDAFLNNFHYINPDKKRSNTNFLQLMFFNKELVAALENIAVKLKADLEGILKQPTSSSEQIFDEFLKAINHACKAAWNARDKLAPIKHLSNIDYIHSSPLGFPILPPEVRKYDSHTPYGRGKFERELLAGLKAASAHLVATDQKTLCEAKITEIRNYKPKEKITNVVCYRPGL